MTYLAAKLRQLRKEHGLTQEQLGAALHVTRQTISNWENDRAQPDYGTLSTIADYFSVPVSALLSEEVQTESSALAQDEPSLPDCIELTLSDPPPPKDTPDEPLPSESSISAPLSTAGKPRRFLLRTMIAAAVLIVLMLSITLALPPRKVTAAFSQEYFTAQQPDETAPLSIYTREEGARFLQPRPEAIPHWNVRFFLKGSGSSGLTVRMITTVLFSRDGSQQIDALEEQQLLSQIGHAAIIPGEMRFFTFSSPADKSHVGVGIEVKATDDAGLERCFTFYQPLEYIAR